MTLYTMLSGVLLWLGLIGLAWSIVAGGNAKPTHWFDE